MATEPTQGSGNDTMGISFNEVHADEPREEITPNKVEAQSTGDANEKLSHLSNHGHVFNVGNAYEGGHIETGTIVSDKKKNRPGLLDNIRSAMHEWWGSAKDTLEDTVEEIPRPVKEEKPVVAKVETRTEVVQKAAEKATFAPKDDHKAVVQKIRTFKQDVARATGAPITIKGPEEEKERTWKHTEINESAQKENSIPSITKVDLRHATIAPHVPQVKPVPAVKSTPLPPPPKGHAVPTPPVQKSVLPTPPVSSIKPPVAPLKGVVTPSPVTKLSTPAIPSAPTTLKPTLPSTPKPQATILKPIPPQAPKFAPSSVPITAKPTPATPANTQPPRAFTSSTKLSSVTVPPTVVKKTFTPPKESVTVAPVIRADRKIVSEPVAPAWQHTLSHTEAEKPHIYTKKDFEKQTPAPAKPPLSALKPEQKAVPSAIHDSLTVPKIVSEKPSSGFLSHTPSTTVTQPKKEMVSTPAPITTAPSPITKTIATPIQAPQESPAPKSIPQPVVPSVVKTVHTESVPKEATPQRATYNAPKSVEESVMPQAPRQAPVTETRPRAEEATSMPAPSYTPAPTYTQTTQAYTQEAPRAQQFQQTPPPTPEEGTPVPSLFQNPKARHVIRYAILALVAIFGVTLAVVLSIYFNVFAPQKDTTPTVLTIPSFFSTESQTGVPLEGSSEALRTRIDGLLRAGQGVTQVYPTQKEGESTRIATAKEFFIFLNTKLNEKTIRSLDDALMIGSVGGEKKEPFIILRSYNFDTLFSGFLAWEPYMQEDLAPLFGTEIVKDARFKDAVRGNASTRILYDTNGNEVLLYSLVNQNTVVITTSGEALSAIIEKF